MDKEHETFTAFKQKLKLLNKIEKARNGFAENAQVGLTKLSRSTEWRQNLEISGALQVLDRKKTVGILLDPKVFEAMLEYLNLIEEEMELASFAAMCEQRKGTIDFLSGDELTSETIALFEKNQKIIRKFLDSDD